MPAFLAGPLLKWAIIGLVIAVLIAAVIWQTHEVDVAREAQEIAEKQARLSAEDAARWQQASQHRDGVIVSLTASLDEQSAAIAASRAKEAELRKNLDSARQQNDRLQEQADQLSKELDDEETKAPGDVVPLGPIVQRRASRLFDN